MPAKAKETPETPETVASGERIAKRMARSGLCSRRDAERLIAEGRVAVDGELLTTPAVVVGPASLITVDGEPLPAVDRTRLFRFHKPAGVVTAARDTRDRATIYDRMPAELPRLMPVGRLDLTSEGLLLLTNDGELKRALELPTTGWQRRYRVRVHGQIDEAALAGLKAGITVDGFRYGSIEARIDRVQGSNAWLTVGLREGKNREIRKVCEHFGWVVTRLIRISFGPFHLGKLASGEVEEVVGKVLKEQIGSLLAAGGGRHGEERAKRRVTKLPAARPAEPADRGRQAARSAQPPDRGRQAARPAQLADRKRPAARPAEPADRERQAARSAQPPNRGRPAARPAQLPDRKRPAARPAEPADRERQAARPAQPPNRERQAARSAQLPDRKRPAARPAEPADRERPAARQARPAGRGRRP